MQKIVQHNFLGGQLDFEMMGRQDVEKYRSGASTVKNLIFHKRGGLFKRPGTDLVRVMDSHATAPCARLIPFASTQTDGWCLLFFAANASSNASITAHSKTESLLVTGSPYIGSEIDEIDFCQCGDILYLAHRNHPPARIEHRIVGSTHTFVYKAMDFSAHTRNRPEVISSTVEKQAVSSHAAYFTEHYKVSSVFDDEETAASDDYFGIAQGFTTYDPAQPGSRYPDYDDTFNDWCAATSGMDHVTKFSSIPGTTYTLPWTQSQKIVLKIRASARMRDDGSLELPNRVMVYRRNGSYFGAVGILSLRDVSTGTDIPSATLRSSSDDPSYSLKITNGASFPRSTNAEITRANAVFDSDYNGYPYQSSRWQFKREDGFTKPSVTIDFSSPVQNPTVEIHCSGFYPSGKLLVKYGDGFANSATLGSFPEITGTSYAVNPSSVTISGTVSSIRIEPQGNVTRWSTFYIKVTSNGFRVPAATVTDGGQAVGDHLMFEFTDRFFTPDASITPVKPTEMMAAEGDNPGCVCVSQQRLIWASTRNDPNRIFMSRIGNFNLYAPHEAMVADDPIDFQVSATRFPAINHIVEMRKLILFNGDSEWVVDSASSNSGITFETIQARQHSSIGAARHLKPIVCNNSLIFAERTGQAVRRYGYQLEDDGFGGEDISIYAASIFAEKKIVSWAYQQHPHSMLWCVLSDGSLASLTFNREQNTVAWATHSFSGMQALSIAATSALIGNNSGRPDTSQMFILVRRVVGTTPFYYLLQMRPESNQDSDTVANAVCLDLAQSIGPNDPTPTGCIAIDAATGAQTSATNVQRICGLPIASEFVSAFPVTGDEIGTGMTGVKTPQHAHLRLVHSTGGKIAATGTPAGQFQSLPTSHSASNGFVAFSKTDADVPLAASNTPDGRLSILHDSHFPFGLVRLETDIATEDD